MSRPQYRELKVLPSKRPIRYAFVFSTCDGQILSSRTISASIAMSAASRNVAENVPRLILFAILAPARLALRVRVSAGRFDEAGGARRRWRGESIAWGIAPHGPQGESA